MSHEPTAPAPQRDPIPSFVHEVIGLFEEALGGVRFPDLDCAQLERMASATRAAQLELERVENELLLAQALVKEQTAVLLAGAERGLAYARVFAQGDAALGARIDQLGGQPSSAPRRTQPAKKRGRKPAAGGDALFSDEPAATVSAAAE